MQDLLPAPPMLAIPCPLKSEGEDVKVRVIERALPSPHVDCGKDEVMVLPAPRRITDREMETVSTFSQPHEDKESEKLIKLVKAKASAKKISKKIPGLISNGARPSFQDEAGRTALHYIAERTEKRYTRVAHSLLDCFDDELYLPELEDKKGWTPLHYAVNNKCDHMASLLIQYSNKDNVRKLFGPSGSNSISLHAMIQEHKMKRSVLAVLDCLWDEPEEGQEATAHFALLNQDGSSHLPLEQEFKAGEMTCFHLLARTGDEHYINHQVITEIINSKWKHARFHYIVDLVCNVFVAACLLIAAMLAVAADDVSDYSTPVSGLRLFCEIVVCIGMLLRGTREAAQCHSYGRKYWRDNWNYADILSVVLVVLIIPLRATNQPAQWLVFSLAYFISIFRLIKFFAISWYLMSYVQIIRSMWREFGSFLLMYSIVFLACVGSFSLTLPFYYSPPAVSTDTVNRSQPIKLWQILVASSRTILDHDASEKYFQDDFYVPGFFPVVFLLIFTFVSLIVLLNVLIAQLAEVYRTAQQQAKLAALKSRASLIVNIETRYLWLTNRFPGLKDLFRDKMKVRKDDENGVVTTEMLNSTITEVKGMITKLVAGNKTQPKDERDGVDERMQFVQANQLQSANDALGRSDMVELLANHNNALVDRLDGLQDMLAMLSSKTDMVESLVMSHNAIIKKLENLEGNLARLSTQGTQHTDLRR